MPDENTDPNQNANTPAGNTGQDWLSPEARELVSRANNEAAGFRTQLRAKTEEHTAALAETERLAGEKTAAEERAAAAEKALLKYRVAIGTGMAPDGADTFAALLQGNDETELKAHADQLLGVFGKPTHNQQNATDPSQGHGDGESGLSEGASFISRSLRGR